MDVSIIIPTINEAAHIAHAIRRAWRAGASEVIVVDGGSDDETIALAGTEPCQLIRAARGRGPQQNEGARVARGDVLLFLHADNWLAPGAVSQIEAELADPRCVGGAFRQQIEHDRTAFRWIERGNAWRAKWLQLPYGDQGLFVRRDCFWQVDGFPALPLMEDVVLVRRLARRGRLALAPGPLAISPRRWLQHGIVKQTLRNWALMAAYRVGVSPDRLARFYPSHAEAKHQTGRGPIVAEKAEA